MKCTNIVVAAAFAVANPLTLVEGGRWDLRSSSFFDYTIDYQGRFLQEQPPDTVDVVIYGATPAGLYAGLRLLEKVGTTDSKLRADLFPNENITVAIYEPSNRSGGRLLTATPSNIANFYAELGDLAYPSLKNGLTNFVVEYLGLDVQDVSQNEDSNLVYIRGNRMRMSERAAQAQNLYAMNFMEKNVTPEALLSGAIEMIVPNAFTLNETAWENVIQNYKFNGEYLRNLGFLNVLSQVLSPEAFQYVKDATAMDAYFANHNALDVIGSIVYLAGSPLKKPVDGMEAIATGLADRVMEAGGDIFYDRILTGLNKAANASDILSNATRAAGDSSDTLVLEFTDSAGNTTEYVNARFVILAVPPEQLATLMLNSPYFEDQAMKDAVAIVTSVPNSKLYLCYDYPWWQNLGIVKGQSITDLPIRSTQYLESGCIAATYNEGSSTPYWTALQPTNSLNSLDITNETRAFSDPGLLWDSVPAANWMIQDAQRQLKKLHNMEFIPDPTAAAFVDSDSVGNSQHFYKVGVDPAVAAAAARMPRSDWNVFVAGEAFHFPRGYLESDLSSAEAVLETYFMEQPQPNTFDSAGAFSLENHTRIGSSLSASEDGMRIAAVSYTDEGGDVTVFQYAGDGIVGIWTPVGTDFAKKYIPTDLQGNVTSVSRAVQNAELKVALSGDGNSMALSVVDANAKFGYVQMFRDLGNGNWTKIGSDLVSDQDGASFGNDIALSYAGDRLAVGAPRYGKNGRVTVYACSSDGCQPFGLSMDGIDEVARFGYSVSVSEDGNVVAVGAPNTGNTVGYAAVFGFDGGAWRQRGETLSGGEDGDEFGFDVSLSGDGNTLAVGAPYGLGVVYVYSYNGEWNDIAGNFTVGDANDNAGYSVRLSGDGSSLIVGVPQIDSNSTGYAVVYKYTDGQWTERGDKLTGDADGEMAGYSVAIVYDGSAVAVGMPESGSTGVVRTYAYVEEPTSEFEQTAREIWADAAINGTTPYPWNDADQCIQNPTLMPGVANNSTTRERWLREWLDRLLQDNATLPPLPIPMNQTYPPVPTALDGNVTLPPFPAVTDVLTNFTDSSNTTDTTETVTNTDGGDTTNSSRPVETTVGSIDVKELYAALAEDVVLSLQDPRLTLDVANAMLFNVDANVPMSDCVSLLDAAQWLEGSNEVDKDLRDAIQSARDDFESSLQTPTPTPAPGVVTLPPVSMAPNGTLAPTISSDDFTGNGTDTNTTDASNTTDANAVAMKVFYRGVGWTGLGISEIGEMVGSIAVIGIPADTDTTNVMKYRLASKNDSGVVPMAPEYQTLQDVQILQNAAQNVTIMKFKKYLDEAGELPIIPSGNTNFIYAHGMDNTLGYHGPGEDRGSFLLDVGMCDQVPNDCKTDLDTTYAHKHVVLGTWDDPVFAVYFRKINL